MSDPRPLDTATIVKRLRRVAKWLEREAPSVFASAQERAAYRARANTIWQAAGRLEDLQKSEVER